MFSGELKKRIAAKFRVKHRQNDADRHKKSYLSWRLRVLLEEGEEK
jgi:hypothetical protein